MSDSPLINNDLVERTQKIIGEVTLEQRLLALAAVVMTLPGGEMLLRTAILEVSQHGITSGT
jgi:hypothetical protein